MKFRIRATDIYPDDSRIIDKYPALKEYGFEVVEERKTANKVARITDENGNLITQERPCSWIVKKAFIRINSLEELLELRKDVDNDIIIYRESNTIEIYDGYRE